MNQNDTGVDKKIVDRIRKLLSLANSKVHNEEDDNEHERDTAMKMALKLMAKHNLSMHDMSTQHGVKEEDRISEEIKFRDDPWAASLVMVAAEMFFCFVYQNRGNKKFVFIGKESNVATAKEMAAYLIDSVAKASRRATTKAGGSSSFKTAFRRGATSKIYQRAKAIQREAEQESEAEKTPGTSIVLASFYKQEQEKNKAFVAGKGVTLTTTVSRQRAVRSQSGYSQGRDFGNTVNFNKQVK